MRVERVVLREVGMRLVAPFETSFGATEERRILLVEAEVSGGKGGGEKGQEKENEKEKEKNLTQGTQRHPPKQMRRAGGGHSEEQKTETEKENAKSGRVVSGWGEATAGETPYYSPETTETAWHVLRDFLWPAVKGREVASAAEVWGLFGKVRGHNMAKAGLETALWDAEAKLAGVPLWRMLGGVRGEIASGLSIGIKPTEEELLGAVGRGVSEGYQRIKVKIKPGWDVEVLGKIREKHPRLKLMADANSAYTLADAGRLKEMDRFGLMMIEQPLGWDDLYSHVKLQRQMQTPICLDECIHTMEQCEAAVEMGACKIINIKLGRVGGHTVARRMQEYCAGKAVPVWCGGMLESGVGRAHNVAMSAQGGFVLPGDVAASKRYWKEDVIRPEVEVSGEGTIQMREEAGIGYEVKRELVEEWTVRREVLG